MKTQSKGFGGYNVESAERTLGEVMDYPDPNTLAKISSWPITSLDDCRKLMLVIEEHWSYPDYFQEDPKGTWKVSTGGWSGNEEIISAMQSNTMFWLLSWHESRRGGHYVFRTL